MGNKRSISIVLGILIVILFISIIIAISFGALKIPFNEIVKSLSNNLFNTSFNVDETFSSVIWKIRLPRVLMSIIIGAGLALCGVIMQAIVQNPLADPYILGISSGGYAGAALFIALGATTSTVLSDIGLILTSFIGSAFAAVTVLFLASYKSKMTTTKLILSGTIANALCMAIGNFVIAIFATDDAITRITFWNMGSLSSSNWDKLIIPLVFVIMGSVFFMTQYRTLNTMLQGDETAITLGVNVNTKRKIFLVIISFITASVVSNCGIIGFVGLIVPHICRAIVGAEHRRLIPTSILFGAIFLTIVDTLARTLIENMELPIGIFTAIIGAPFFAYIMIRKNYGFSRS